METAKVEFTTSSGQKIIIDFTLDENDNLDYTPSYEPKITDPKTNLGLAGQLCEIFITTLMKMYVQGIQIKDYESKRKLES